MRSAQLEALVRNAIDAVRAGHQEDDRFEFKRTWPGEDKARQLAGSANQARGEALIYVIGLAEDGTILPPDDIEPASWFSQLESKFDGPPPRIVNHVRVAVSDSESVVAIEFDTDAAPYVVRISGTSERDVPIRVGTRTRSANRGELLRMLYPTLHVPRIEVLTATLHLKADKAFAVATLNASSYFELAHQAPLFLPDHKSHANLVGPRFDEQANITYPANDRLYLPKPMRDGLPPIHPRGLFPRPDGLELTGPGTVAIRAEWRLPGDYLQEIGSWGSAQVRLTFGIAGTDEVAHGELRLDHRKIEAAPSSSASDVTAPRFAWTLISNERP